MAKETMKPVVSLLLVLNFCMYVVLLGIGGWGMNEAIDHGFIIGPGFELPAHFSPIYFPMGNAATGFFVMFSLISGVVGSASCISGFNNLRTWSRESLPATITITIATIAWTLTLLAMGFGCKEISLVYRNASLVAMEAFSIILYVTQLLYIGVLSAPAY